MNTDVCIVNAFTINGSGGNPAGVVLDADYLNTTQMRKIAHQVGVSETVFVLKGDKSTFRFRFFTPTVEVGLCGHATIAAWAFMLQKGLVSEGNYIQSNIDGIIKIQLRQDGRVYMQQPAQVLKETVLIEPVVSALNIKSRDLDKRLQPQIMQKQLMVALKSESILDSIEPDFDLVSLISRQHGFYGFHVFVLPEDGDITAHVRNFCPIVGINEDAATGTANGSLLDYLRIKYMLPEGLEYKLEQGKTMGRRSQLYGMFKNSRVWIGGEASIKDINTIRS